MTTNPPVKLTKKDFATDQLVRWCPGCGDYAILAQVQAAMADLGWARENFAVVAGIGCSSRFPYYMNTYGFHTIHGRAPAFATGLKTTRPELSVWLVTGDGDGLSIGGNHLLHLWRRNVDLNVMMFNNRIYGLTKGQYSPTSEVGKKTKSSPFGSLDTPVDPVRLALGAGCSRVARSVDRFTKHLKQTLIDGAMHKGTSFTEIYQNCNIFNDGAYEHLTERTAKTENVLYLEDGQPLIWGSESRRGLVLDGLKLKAVDIANEADEAQCIVHDTSSKMLALLLAELDGTGGFPVPIGLFYCEERPTYDGAFREQINEARQKLGDGDIERLIRSGDTWTV